MIHIGDYVTDLNQFKSGRVINLYNSTAIVEWNRFEEPTKENVKNLVSAMEDTLVGEKEY